MTEETQPQTDVYGQIVADVKARLTNDEASPASTVRTVATGCTHGVVAHIVDTDQDFDQGLQSHEGKVAHMNTDKMLALFTIQQMATISMSPAFEEKDYVLQTYDQISLFVTTVLYRLYSAIDTPCYLVPMTTDENDLPRFLVVFKTARNTCVQLIFHFDVIEPKDDSTLKDSESVA